MAGRPFAERARYVCFLLMLHALHDAVAALYDDPALRGHMPDLDTRKRLPDIERDLGDLGVGDIAGLLRDHAVRGEDARPIASDPATALGWLYVVEGSTLGAAFLFKAASKLDLDAAFGARSLAAHPDGRARHWKSFVAALDAMPLTAEEEARVVEGARAAFALAHDLAERLLPVPADD